MVDIHYTPLSTNDDAQKHYSTVGKLDKLLYYMYTTAQTLDYSNCLLYIIVLNKFEYRPLFR